MTYEKSHAQRDDTPFEQDRVTAIYNRNAPWFEFVDAPMERLVFKRWRRELLKNLQGEVLEVGVGTGRNFPYYPKSGEVQMTAIDVADKMLVRAHERKKERGLDVNLQLADVQDLPFDDDAFDTVLATTVFCSVADPVQGLREIERVLRPGGELRLLEHQRPNQPALARLFDVLNPLAVRLSGANINRQTNSNVRKADFVEVTSKSLDAFGIVQLIRGVTSV